MTTKITYPKGAIECWDRANEQAYKDNELRKQRKLIAELFKSERELRAELERKDKIIKDAIKHLEYTFGSAMKFSGTHMILSKALKEG